MGNFVNTRKNFPDAQKLSGRQCRHADEVFGTLLQVIPTTKYLNLFFSIKTFHTKTFFDICIYDVRDISSPGSDIIENIEIWGILLFCQRQQNSSRFVDAPVSPYTLTLLYLTLYKVQFTKQPQYLDILYIL